MQPSDTTDPATGAGPQPTRIGLWKRIQAWDGHLSVFKSLTIVTALTSLLGGYFQYLSAYEDKVREQARADMAAATSTFVEISNAFAEAQTLQQLVYFDFNDTFHADNGANLMVSQAAQETLPKYLKARETLRQNSDIFARKAELYIDWASDLGHDPAAAHPLQKDPLNETLLGNYNFDCNAEVNFPHFGSSDAPAAKPENPVDYCARDNWKASDYESSEYEKSQKSQKSTVNLCAITKGKQKKDDMVNNTKKTAIVINWHSAKHHVVTMHYCFKILHGEIETARIWASKNEVSDDRRTKFLNQRDKYQGELSAQVVRLNAFMTLAMAQLEQIRAKYRPSGFWCHVPGARDVINLFSNKCTPLKTAEGGTT